MGQAGAPPEPRCETRSHPDNAQGSKGAEHIAGRGLIAVEAIRKGEVVPVKGGHIVSTTMLQSLPERLQCSDVQITDDLHLVALLFLNHSCEPNVGFDGNTVLVAMRDVQAGEEP